MPLYLNESASLILSSSLLSKGQTQFLGTIKAPFASITLVQKFYQAGGQVETSLWSSF